MIQTILTTLDPATLMGLYVADHLLEAGIAMIIVRRWRARRAVV